MADQRDTSGRDARLGRRWRGARDAAAARVFRVPVGDRDYTLTPRLPVTMRDGVTLLTDVYVPIGPSAGTILVRTPYGRTGPVAFLTAALYARHGYLVVNQSCRGTAGSGGEFEPFRREIDDGADTVAWLRQQPWFDGRLALCGPSYLGFTAWAVMMDPPPELVTAVIAVAGIDNHRIHHGDGAFALEQTLNLMDGFGHLDDGPLRVTGRVLRSGRRLAPGYRELPLERAQQTVLAGSRMPYREWLTHPEADADCWRPMRLTAALDRVGVPVLLQAGWQDRFPDHMIDHYEQLHRRGVDVALTVGPWTHIDFSTKAAGPVATESLQWLAQHLARSPQRARPAGVRIFVSGADTWRQLPSWPPETTDHLLYLQPGGALGSDQPAEDAPPSAFRYDPRDPTPAVGGRVINPAIGGYRDNRRLERRDDVLTFTSAPLAEPLEVVGNPEMELRHHTDNPYADLFVRLCDVAPDGRSVNLADGFRRLDAARADGTITIRLEAMAHRFQPGARIRVQVSGGAHPRYARNLGTGADPATGTTMTSSQRSISHGRGGVSLVRLPRYGGS